MIFLHPQVFWSVPAVCLLGAALYFWSRRARRRRLVLFTTFAETEVLLRSRQETARVAGHALLVLGLVFAILAFARPLTGPKSATAEREGIDVLLAIDVSKSMLTPDVKPFRLEAARTAILDWLPDRANDRVGIILFAGDAFLQIPLTNDLGVVRTMLDGIHPTGRGGSNLELAIQTAIDVYARKPGKSRALIVFSDGENHEGDPVQKAKGAFQSHGVRTFTIGVGTIAGGKVPNYINGAIRGEVRNRYGVGVQSRLDAPLLRSIATEGGGAYLSLADNPSALADLQRQHLSRLLHETREIQTTDYDEWFQLPLLFALLCFVGERFSHRLAAPRRRPDTGHFQAALALGFLLTVATPFVHGVEPTRDAGHYQTLIASGRAKDAVAALREEAAQKPDDAFTLYNLGVAEYAAGNFAESALVFEKVLGLPNSEVRPRAFVQLGNARVRLGEAKLADNHSGAAAVEFERALQSYENPDADAKGVKKNARAAEQVYVETLERIAVSQLDQASRTSDNWTQRRILQKALGALDQILLRKPDHAFAREKDRETRSLLVANLLVNGRQKYAEARATFAKGQFKNAYVPMRTAFELANHAINISPEDPDAQAFLEETRQGFATMLTAKGEDEFIAAMNAPKLSSRLGLLSRASTRSEEALGLDPGNPEARALGEKIRVEIEKAAIADGDALVKAADAATKPASIAINLSQALGRFEMALRANPDNAHAREQIERLRPRLAEALTAMAEAELAAAKDVLDEHATPSAADLRKALAHLGKADEALAQASTVGDEGEKAGTLAAEVAALAGKLQEQLEHLAATTPAPAADQAGRNGKPGQPARSEANDEGKQPPLSKSFSSIRKVSSGGRQPRPDKDW